MNPKLKKKIIIDVVLSAVMVLLMIPSLSGVFFHEWLGLAMGTALFAHLAINRQWIKAVGRRFFGPIGWQARLNFVMNAMLAIGMGTTMLSGILISQYLFAPLAASNLDLWTAIHKVASWSSLGIVAVHVILHLDWIKRAFITVVRTPQFQPVRAVLVRSALGLFALGAIYSVFQTSALAVVKVTADQDQNTSTLLANTTTSTSSTDDSTLTDTDDSTAVVESLPAAGSTLAASDSATPAVSLSEYLSNFTCTACHRHCLLSSPKCGRAKSQIEQYTQKYEQEYSVTA
ncbi:MAG: conserved rane protein of unknown function [Firmicutes bacterium]|nr:conserved rane protein of unknown function [Bacillota bacterium]